MVKDELRAAMIMRICSDVPVEWWWPSEARHYPACDISYQMCQIGNKIKKRVLKGWWRKSTSIDDHGKYDVECWLHGLPMQPSARNQESLECGMRKRHYWKSLLARKVENDFAWPDYIRYFNPCKPKKEIWFRQQSLNSEQSAHSNDIAQQNVSSSCGLQ